MRLREPFLCIALINMMTTHVLATSEKNPELEKLLNSGREAYNRRDFSSAESIFKNAKELSKGIGSTGKELYAHRWLIKSLTAENKIDEANSSCLEEIEAMKKFAKRPHYLVEALCDLGYLQIRSNKLKEAEATFDRARSIGNKGDCDNYFRTEPLEGLAVIRAQQHRLSDAARLYEEALAYVQDNNFDFLSRAALIRSLADIYEDQGQSIKAAALYQSVVTNYERNDEFDQVGIASLFQDFAGFLRRNQREEEALSNFRRAFDIYQKYHVKSKAATKCRSDYASLLREMNRADEAKKIED